MATASVSLDDKLGDYVMFVGPPANVIRRVSSWNDIRASIGEYEIIKPLAWPEGSYLALVEAWGEPPGDLLPKL